MSAKGKCIYPNLRCPCKSKTCVKKNILLLIAYVYYTHSMSDSTCLYQSVPLSPSSQSVPSSSSHSLQTFPHSSQSFHSISSSVPTIPLHIQHFLKPFTVTSGEMRYHATMIHTDHIIHLHFLVYYTCLNPWRFTVFSTDDINGGKEF